MGEDAPQKVKVIDGSTENTAESGAKISDATNRKVNSVAFPQKTGAGTNPEIPIIASLSDRFNIPTERLQYYRSLHFGYEELVPALVIAKQAQAEVGRVLKLRMGGLGWDAIATSFFIDLKPLNSTVDEVLKPIEQRLPKRALTERPVNQQPDKK
jgi:hypothetical protein